MLQSTRCRNVSLSVSPGRTPTALCTSARSPALTCRPTSSLATTAPPATACSWSPARTSTARRSPFAPSRKAARRRHRRPRTTPSTSIAGSASASASTSTRPPARENHIETSQEIFLKLYEQGDLYLGKMELTYCRRGERFLPDRYVEGTCPICGYEGARGDQCDNCGNALDPIDLINPRCRFDGSTPERPLSEHFFLRLSAYNDQLESGSATTRSTGAATCSTSRWACSTTGLHDRAITRDLDWGVPIPLRGFETSASTSGSRTSSAISPPPRSGRSSRARRKRWRDFWEDPAREDLLLHRQGQHLVPHPDLAGAGWSTHVRRPQPAV